MYVLVTDKNEENQMKKEGPRVVTTLYGHLVIARRTKPVFELEQEFDGHNPHMKFGRNLTKMTKLE